MAETAGAGGYNLNTVSVSEAIQHSTNNIAQGTVTFGDRSSSFTTKQIAIAAVAVIALLYVWKKVR